MDQDTHATSAATEADTRMLDPAFRNGSVTAIGVVLAFSLGFLNNWSTQATPWIPGDLAAVALIACGIFFQIWALAGMLSVNSLKQAMYRRIIRTFLTGLVLVAAGVIIAIGGDAFHYGETLIRR